MVGEEIILKLQTIEQESREIKEQLENADSQISDFETLKASFSKIEKNKEMLTNLGRGIFLKTMAADDKFFINVGSKIFVKKTGKEAEEIVDKQVHELQKIRQELMNAMEKMNLELYHLLEEAQSQQENEHKHEEQKHEH